MPEKIYTNEEKDNEEVLSNTSVISVNPEIYGTEINTNTINWKNVGGVNVPADNATLGATFGVDVAGGGSANTQVTNAGYATLYRYDRWGSGSDGNKTVSGTETLLTDMNYIDLTIPTGTILNAAGYKIRVKGTLTCAGTGKIINSGGNGGGGASYPSYSGGGAGAVAPGGSLPAGAIGKAGGRGGKGNGVSGDDTGQPGGAGDAAVKALSGVGVAGGGGGDCLGTAAQPGGGGGAAGAVTGTVYNIPVDYANATLLLDTQPSLTALSTESGSGGGGGGSASYYAGQGGGGGGSGGAGGMVWIAAKTIANGLNVEAIGGNGGNGGNGHNGGSGNISGNGGGGGGGRGGIIVIIYETIGTYTLTLTGGTKGVAGTGGNGGANGTDGATGVSYLIQV
jgi:hypothetical protein